MLRIYRRWRIWKPWCCTRIRSEHSGISELSFCFLSLIMFFFQYMKVGLSGRQTLSSLFLISGFFYLTLTALALFSFAIWPFLRHLTFPSLFDLSFAIWPFLRYLTFPPLFDLSSAIWPFLRYLTFPSLFDLSFAIWPFIRYLTFPSLVDLSAMFLFGQKRFL